MAGRAEIDAVIRAAKVMRIGLVDGTEPYVVPLSFGYNGTSLYFHCAREGRKLEIIRRSGRVCFEFDELREIVSAPEACGWGAGYRSVIGRGSAVIVEDPAEKRRGLAAVMAQYAGDRYPAELSFPDREVERTCVVRIDVESVTGKQR
jgi:nitroimidazol reductase NimA-like FMN-containing flavoprotein (pyridoxamine 5'-phosphate oxidase superfamily)